MINDGEDGNEQVDYIEDGILEDGTMHQEFS